jgi:hypothetical protein
MGLDPEEKGWAARHPAISTFLVVLVIAAAGFAALKYLKPYISAEEKIRTNPVFLNESYLEVDKYFDINTNLTEKQQDELFKTKYQYNIFKWTCKPLSCQEVIGKPTIKLVCNPNGISEDVRIAMSENCTDQAGSDQVTVVFQLLSKTTGNYYLGRSGKIAK